MSARKWTDEHGAPGLRRKFDVYKTKDDLYYGLVSKDSGHSKYYRGRRLGADGEFIFVLRPETDRAAWAALIDYADNVARRDPQLSEDIERELRRIRVANDQRTD